MIRGEIANNSIAIGIYQEAMLVLPENKNQIDNKNGRTLLHFAVGACDRLDSMERIQDLRYSFTRDGGRRRSEEEDEEKLRTVKNLVEHGANILATDAYGNTVIDYTASGGGKIHAYLQGELIRRNQKLIRHLVEADWFGPCCTTSVKRKKKC